MAYTTLVAYGLLCTGLHTSLILERDINRIMIIKQKGGALQSTCIREIFKHIIDDVLGYHTKT